MGSAPPPTRTIRVPRAATVLPGDADPDAGPDAGPDSAPDSVDRVAAEAWCRPDVQASLAVIVDAVHEVLGYEVAAINGVFGPDEMRVIASAGRPDAVRYMRGRSTSLRRLMDRRAYGRRWGRLWFVPAGADPDPHSTQDWAVPEAAPVHPGPSVHPSSPRAGNGAAGDHVDGSDDRDDVEDSDGVPWDRDDRLFAPLYDPESPDPADGTPLGVLVVDLPAGGLRPDPTARRQLATFADLAARSMGVALRAQQSVERERVTDAARAVLRAANRSTDLTELLDHTVAALRTSFRSDAAWVRDYLTAAPPFGAVSYEPRDERPEARLVDPDAVAGAHRIATAAWRDERSVVIDRALPADDLAEPGDYARAVDTMAAVGFASVLIVPLSAGTEFLGYFAMGRRAPAHAWSPEEREAALAVGRDVGRAAARARNLVHERELTERLRALDEYKRELVTTFSHELRTPLTVVAGYLELLEQELATDPEATASLVRMRRGFDRLSNLVVDLVAMSHVLDPVRHRDDELVDLLRVVDDALPPEPRLGIEVPDTPVRVSGDAGELAYAVAELLGRSPTSGAHTPPSRLRLSEVDDASAREARLEVWHAEDPHPIDTDLSLRVARTIATRHGGRLEVQRDGAATTIALILPVAESTRS